MKYFPTKPMDWEPIQNEHTRMHLFASIDYFVLWSGYSEFMFNCCVCIFKICEQLYLLGYFPQSWIIVLEEDGVCMNFVDTFPIRRVIPRSEVRRYMENYRPAFLGLNNDVIKHICYETSVTDLTVSRKSAINKSHKFEAFQRWS